MTTEELKTEITRLYDWIEFKGEEARTYDMIIDSLRLYSDEMLNGKLYGDANEID